MAEALPKISCMILFKNEKEHLARLIPKAVEAFDEVICVTNLEPNTDGSDELLASHGITPVRMAWVEDFSVARQKGLDASTGDFTMWMDCDDDLLTDCASFSEAKAKAKRFLAESPSPAYMHRVYYHDKKGFWLRENWFRKGCGVKVKYPTHEVYNVDGVKGTFPGGIIDRMNAPLKADYKGKLWRYFDMLYKYLQEVDPKDARCKYYLAREFRGPISARIALYAEYLDQVQENDRYMNFAEEWWSIFQLYNLRDHMDKAKLLDLARKLILRYPFELTAQVLHCMIQCEVYPNEVSAFRFYKVVSDRASYNHGKSPQHKGWYFQKTFNTCGYVLYKISVMMHSRRLAEYAVEMLKLALEDAERTDDVTGLAKNNLIMAERWLAGFPAEELGLIG